MKVDFLTWPFVISLDIETRRRRTAESLDDWFNVKVLTLYDKLKEGFLTVRWVNQN